MLWYLAFRLVTFVVRHVPRRWGVALMRLLGTAIYHVSPLSAGVRDNFMHVVGADADPARISQLAKRSFQGQLLNYYDMMWLSDKSLEEIGWQATFSGLDYVDRLVEARTGAVIVSGHIGPIEHMAQGIASLGYDLFAIFEHLDNEHLLEYLLALRSAHGLDIMSTKGSLIGAYRRIKRGAMLLSALDRDSTDTGRVVTFFGAPAWMPDGYARLAVRADVPIVAAFGQYAQKGPAVTVYPPIYPDRSLTKQEAVTDLVNRSLRLLEEAISADPSAWHLSTPIWRLAQERPDAGISE